jgi:hypothetical protein
MEKFNIIVTNEEGERVYPQGIDWDKWKKRFYSALAWISIGYDAYVIIKNLGGGGFRIMKITIIPKTDQTRN